MSPLPLDLPLMTVVGNVKQFVMYKCCMSSKFYLENQVNITILLICIDNLFFTEE